MGHSLLKKVSYRVLIRINRAVGFRLFTKFGEKGIINLSKTIPFIGGFVGAVVNAYACDVVGNAAKRIFTKNPHIKRVAYKTAA